MLHLFTLLVAVSTAILIFAGGMVTSTGSGLAVPDWPNSYGWFMWSFPFEHWVGGIFYEHAHRLIASIVGFLSVVLAAWLWRTESRAWVRRLGYIALGAVLTQGLLGGMTVLFYLPDPISIAHASLAQIVFCLTVTIAVVTSPGWKRAYGDGLAPDDRMLQRTALVTTALIYTQILIGATMRHTDAGLAIPDFPWAFGHLVPPRWTPQIAVHFAHRVGALVVVTMTVATAAHVLYHQRTRRPLVRGALLLMALVTVQVTLGAVTILSGRQPIINSLHVVTGACVLATSLVLTLRAHRIRFSKDVGGRGSMTSTPATGRAAGGRRVPLTAPGTGARA